MFFRVAIMAGPILTLSLLAGTAWAVPPFHHFHMMPHVQPHMPAHMPMQHMPMHMTNRVHIMGQHPHVPSTTFSTTPWTRSHQMTPNSFGHSNPSLLSRYYHSLYHYDRNLLHNERRVLRYDLHHGINPYASSFPYMYNPYSANPYAYNSYGYNPAASLYSGYGSGAYSQPYGMQGYSSMYPYGMGLYGLYGMMGYGMGGYGAGNYGNGSSSTYATPYANSSNYGNGNSQTGGYAPSAPNEAKKEPSPLTAYGIPNDDGALKWPLAFRLMPAKQQKDQLQKLEAQLQLITTQAVINRANPNLVRETGKSVDRLRAWLQARRTDLPEGTYRDGAAFLNKIDQALQAMRS